MDIINLTTGWATIDTDINFSGTTNSKIKSIETENFFILKSFKLKIPLTPLDISGIAIYKKIISILLLR